MERERPRAPGLAPAERRLALILAHVAAGRFRELARELRAARRSRVPAAWVEETLLMAHLFAGFPRAINAFEAWRALAPRPAASRRRAAAAAGDGALRRRGRAAFERVYGPSSARVLEALGALHPELRERIVVDAYARILARPALPGRLRELCAVTALASGGLPRQCVSHIRGALRAGAAPAAVRGALEAARPWAPAGLVDALLAEVTPRDRSGAPAARRRRGSSRGRARAGTGSRGSAGRPRPG